MTTENTDSMPTLYHSDMSTCAAKVRIALQEKGVAWRGVKLNLRAGDSQRPDYVKLNPKQVVPTLVDRDEVIIESNVILEYIEDRWPQKRLRPADPAATARMRLWTKQLDEGVHAATGTISICIAFRHQFLALPATALQAWFDNMGDEVRRERARASIKHGMESPQFEPAVKRFITLLDDFEQALTNSPWLAGNEYSLADIAYSPYMLRLEHLGLGDLIAERPHVSEWCKKLLARQSFVEGVLDCLDPGYLEIFERVRPEARNVVNRIAHPEVTAQ